MAGDWIKMRIELQSHPKVVRILSATKSDKFRVIGGLHAVWGVFDTHSTDGHLHGYTAETLDHIIGWEGFANAMISVGWLVATDAETLSLPEFDEHNGQSAKRRAEDQKRKRNGRRDLQPVRKLSANEPDKTSDKKRTREEKINKEINKEKPLPEDFAISERVQNWAKEKGHSQLEAHFEHFVGSAKAKGYKYVDWDEAFMNAIRNNWAKLEQEAKPKKRGVVI